MARQTEHREIDGRRWSVTPFGGREGHRVYVYLLHKFGPSLASVVGSLRGGKGVLDTSLDMVALSKGLESLFGNLSESEHQTFVERLLSATKVDGKDINFDIDFMQAYLTLYKVLLFVLEVNYGDFFVEWKSKLAANLSAIREGVQSSDSAPDTTNN